MAIDLVLIGLVMALEPVPLTVFILILASKRGLAKGAAFVSGWMATLAVVAGATILATGNRPPKPNTAPSVAILAAKIVLGVALLVVAERQRRKMARPRKPKKEPRWQGRIDDMSPLFAVGLGAFFQPSVLVVSAAATITEAKLSSVANYLTLVLFGIVASSSYLVMEVYAALRPERSSRFLANLKGWIDRHTDLIIIVAAVALGLWLIGKSSYLLAT